MSTDPVDECTLREDGFPTVPVPRGIGVAEFGLMVGPVAAGMSEEAAFATAVLHRVATFSLPPLWGFLAMRWLQRNALL